MIAPQAANICVVVHCEGDRHIDDHHTAEDVAITLGQCFHEALGDKKGLAVRHCCKLASASIPLPSLCWRSACTPCSQRMGCAEGAHGGARVRAVLDLSNRPHFESDLPLDEENVGAIEYGKPS